MSGAISERMGAPGSECSIQRRSRATQSSREDRVRHRRLLDWGEGPPKVRLTSGRPSRAHRGVRVGRRGCLAVTNTWT